ncbi:hypothetical protein [Compostibacter hankyongensis]
MKTKPLLLISFFLLLAACRSGDRQAGTQEQADSVDTAAPNISDDLRSLPQWTGFLQKTTGGRFDVRKFDFLGSDVHQPPATDSFSAEEWNTYRPYLKYNPAGTLAIDLYSYNMIPVKRKNGTVTLEGGEPDAEVALVAVKTGRRQRLLFSGPGTLYQDARWLNDSVAVITGISDANESNQPLPVVWRYHVNGQRMETFGYADSLSLGEAPHYTDSLLQR